MFLSSVAMKFCRCYTLSICVVFSIIFILFIYLFKTVTVKRKNCDTRIMVDFGRLSLPKKTSWTSLVATKFPKKVAQEVSRPITTNFFLSGDWVRRM